MPVNLSPADYQVWLDPEKQDPAELTYLYEPFPAVDMESYLVGPKVNNARNEGADLVKPIDEGMTEQKSLFETDADPKNSK